MVRRFAMLIASLSVFLILTGAHHLLAQDEKKVEQKETVKKDEPKKDDTKKDEAKKDEVKKDEPKKDEVKKEEPKKEEPLPPIPAEVEAKLKAARKAVAEAIVAAQDAGLVKTSIEPPPILDILITGRATDESALKARTGVSPEVFGAWFTGYGKTAGINPQTDVRIIPPGGGLKSWYEQRAAMLTTEIEAVRKAMPKKEEPKKEEPKKEETKKEETKKEDVKKDTPK
jgi:pentapeptide MXKDX repeat protein